VTSVVTVSHLFQPFTSQLTHTTPSHTRAHQRRPLGPHQGRKGNLGYDREAYEQSLQLPKVFKGQSATIPTAGADGEMMLLFRLGGLLDTPEKVKEIAGLEELPIVREGESEMGIMKFCVVSKEVQGTLEEWLKQRAVLQT
jgi:hypothetical protein